MILLTQAGLPTNPSNPLTIVPLSAGNLTYYTGVFTAQGQVLYGNNTAEVNAYVQSQILGLEQQNTAAYTQLYNIFGPGGSYAAGGANNYDAATNSTVTITSSLTGAPVSTQVIYGNVNGNGTLMLTDGQTWASLGYVIGEGIFFGSSSDPNANGTTFSATAQNAYYTIQAISGGVLTLTTALTVDNQATVNLSPVVINGQNSTLQPVATPSTVTFGNVSTITLAGGGSWTTLGYQVGGGIFVGSSTDPNANGATFNGQNYYTIAAINGDVITLNGMLTAESATVNLASVTINAQNPNQSTLTSTATSTAVNFANVGTVTLASGASWTSLGYTAGQGIFVGSSTEVNANGNGSTLAPAITSTNVNFANANTLTPVITSTNVNFGNNGSGKGTITLTASALAAGASWNGYTVGEGIYIQGTGTNGNGATFTANSNDYYVIGAISGATITLTQGLTAQSNATVGLAAVTINGNASSLTPPAITSTNVNFGNDGGGNGTITLTASALAAGANWNNYTVGDGIYIQGTGTNGNGVTFTANSNDYYVIGAISGATITLTQGLTAESNATVGLAAVTIGTGLITLTANAIAAGANWNGYSVGEGIYIQGTGPNGNGATFTPNSNDYYVIGAISGATITLTQGLTAQSNAAVGLSPVTINGNDSSLAPAVTSTNVNFGNNGSGEGTITLTANALAAGANWNGYTVGEGVYVQGTDTNGNGATFKPNSNDYYVIGAISGATITLTQGLTAENNATVGLSPVTINGNGGTFNAGAPNPYYTIGSINGSVLTLTAGETFTPDVGVTVNLSPVAINTQTPSQSVLQAMTTPTGVIFGSSGATSTLTLTNGGSWASLGYTVGQGIYVGSSGLNGNGSSFTGGNYYTIAGINGDVITLQSGENLQSETTANLAPVTINGVNSTLTPVVTSANVNFGSNADGMGTITLTATALAAGANWSAYTVGEGIYVQGTGTNENGASFTPNAGDYYLIGAINGATITLTQALTAAGSAVTTGFAPVTVVTSAVNETSTSSVVGTPTATAVSFANSGSNGTITLVNGGSWSSLGYQVGQGIFIASATDPNGNGATFDINTPLPFYTISGISGDVLTLSQTVTAETNVTLDMAPVVTVTPHNTVVIDNYNPYVYDPNFTYLLTSAQVSGITSNIKIWTPDELLAGISQGLLEQTTSTQAYIEAPIITADNITIVAGTNGNSGNIGSLVNPVTNEVGFVPGTTLTDGSTAQLALAAAARTDLNFLTIQPATVEVNFSGDRMTLVNGASWSSITGPTGASVDIQQGDELYIGGTSQNATENNQYLTVASVSGSTVTFTSPVVSESNQTVLVSPVVVTQNQSTVGSSTSEVVNFGNFNNSGTITLANGGTWTGYTVGEGIFIGSPSDPNANSASFDVNASNPYYTITAINGSTITVQGTLKVETGATVNAAPVTINVNVHADQIGFVLISQNKDVALTASGTVTATANGFIYLGSQDNLQLNTIVGGSVNDPANVRVKTQGEVTNAIGSVVTVGTSQSEVVNFGNSSGAGTITLASGTWSSLGYAVGNGIFVGSSTDTNANGSAFNLDAPNPYYIIAAISGNVLTLQAGQTLTVENGVSVSVAPVTISPVNIQGAQIIVEAGQSFIGTQADPVTVNVLGVNGSFTARALDDINIYAPLGNVPVDAIYSASGALYLLAYGAIYDAVQPASDFAKIEAQKIELTAHSIGDSSGGALHLDVLGGAAADGLRADAEDNINIAEADGNLDVLDVISQKGNITLGAAASIVNVGNLVDPLANINSALAANGLGANVYGNSIILNAGQGANETEQGGISAADGISDFNIVSAYSGAGTVSASADDANIHLDGVTFISTLAGMLNVSGNIALETVTDAAAIAFILAGGAITNGRSDNNAIITAGAADLTATGNIGSSSNRTGGWTGFITSTVNNIDAQSTTGSIYLWNIGPAIAGSIQGVSSPYALYAPEGSIDAKTSSPFTQSANDISAGPIVIQAGSATDTFTDLQSSDLTIDPGVTVQSTTSSVELDGGNNVDIESGAQITAATSITVVAGYLDPTAPTAGEANGTVNIAAGATLNATTTITIDAANDINIDGVSGNTAAAQLNANTSITLQAGYLSDISAVDSNTTTLDLSGSYTTVYLYVYVGSGDADVEFDPTSLDADTFIDGGAGDDTIHVFDLPNLDTYADYVADDGVVANTINPLVDNTINLDGGDGADTYNIDATDDSNYVINVSDSGTDYLDGLNTLNIYGATTTSGQEFLLRNTFVAIVQSDGNGVYQRINYDNTITGGLDIYGGNVDVGSDPSNYDPNNYGNAFYLDGNSAVTTINSGDGNDTFQVGQVYSTTDFAGLSTAGDVLTGTPILNGAPGALAGGVGALAGDGLNLTGVQLGVDPATFAELSDGVDYSTVLYGGAGTNTFTVYANKADLSLIGGSGNDTFIVRAFLVAAGTHIAVQGGSGNDTIEYNIDAPVDIEGGTGFNTLVLLGTAANDTFVVTQDGIFGGGLNISYTNIQAVTIDGLEGNDTIYVESTPVDVVTTIDGGAGDDTTVVGGDVTGAVISASSQGSSSVTDNAVTSDDSDYDNIFAAGIQVTVGNTSGGAVISQQSQSIVHVGDTSSISYFTVSAPTITNAQGQTVALANGQTAYVDVTPTLPSAEWGNEGADSLQVSTDGVHWSSSLALAFTNNNGTITSPQTVFMRAAPTSNFSYTRNETIVVASAVFATGGSNDAAFDSLVLPVVKVTLETSAIGLVIDQGLASTTMVEGQSITTYSPQATTIAAGQTTYTYNLSLNQQPAAGQTVTVTLAGTAAAGQTSTPSTALPSDISLSGPGVTYNGNGTYSVTFDSSDWDTPVAITVSATPSGTPQPEQDVDIQQWVSASAAGGPYTVAPQAGGAVSLTVAATNTPGVLLLQPPGEATVTPAQNYTYQMLLTSQPTADVTVALEGDGQTYATSSAPGFDPTVFDPNGTNPYYVITGISGDTLTLQAAPGFTPPTFTAESNVSVNLAPVTITEGTLSSQSLTFGNVGSGSTEAGTITLVDGASWASLDPNYTVGNGIYLQGTEANGNGNSFDATQSGGYYTIASINGSTLTLQQGQSLTANSTAASYDVAPVNIAAASTTATQVNFGSNGTITLSGGTAGYQMGQGIFVGSTTDANANSFGQTVTYTPSDWNVPVTLTLHQNLNYVLPTGGSQGSNPATDMTFPAQPHTLALIQGPLIVDGGTQPGQPTLVASVALPYETQNTPVSEPSGPGEGAGSPGIDSLEIFDDGTQANEAGELTTLPANAEFGTLINDPNNPQYDSGYGDNISGLDIPDLVVPVTQPTGETISATSITSNTGTVYEDGISFVNLDAVELFLGTGNDTFTIDTTQPTINADDGKQTMMVIEGGGGSNTINVTASSDSLVLYGADSGSGVEYSGLPSELTPDAYNFIAQGHNYGYDTINASGATGTVVIVGGPDGNTITGGSGVNWIAGNGGGDIITAAGAQNYIFGDSSFTVGQEQLETFDNETFTVLNLTVPTVTIDNDGTSAASNVITVTGDGQSTVFGDYATMQIVGQSLGIADPFEALGGPEIIQTIESVNTALGGNNIINVSNVDSTDIVIGGAGDDRIILGSGGQNIVLGDNGEIDYTYNSTTQTNVLTSIELIDPLHGGDDVISGQWVTGLPTGVTFGNSNGAGTITLTGGASWASLGYVVGGGIYIQGTGTREFFALDSATFRGPSYRFAI